MADLPSSVPELEGGAVALKLDPHARERSWVTLRSSRDPARANGLENFGVLSCAANEFVHPDTYLAVSKELGLTPITVAPYPVKRSYCGARIVVWLRDDFPPNEVASVHLRFDGESYGRWPGTCFVVAYPKLPAVRPTLVPGSFMEATVRPEDAHYCLPLDTRAVLEDALTAGAFSAEWLSAAEASQVPLPSFSRSMRVQAASDGSILPTSTDKILTLKCAVCSTPCSKRCQRCNEIAYCGKECQTADWRRHKRECSKKNAL